MRERKQKGRPANYKPSTSNVGKKKEWRSFDEARGFIHQLGLRNTSEWRAYCTSGQKPDDIPSAPNAVYGSEFAGFGDWLGTGYAA